MSRKLSVFFRLVTATALAISIVAQPLAVRAATDPPESPSATASPSSDPSARADAQPTDSTAPKAVTTPSDAPSASPTPEPSSDPVADPTSAPEVSPTAAPATEPSTKPAQQAAPEVTTSPVASASASKPTATASQTPDAAQALPVATLVALIGGFEIDGDLTPGTMNPPGKDWNGVQYGSYFDGFNDTTQLGGKETDPANWVSMGPNAAPKTDFDQIRWYAETVGNSQYLALALVRASGTGSTNYNVEFNQVAATGIAPTRTKGDILLNITHRLGGLHAARGNG